MGLTSKEKEQFLKRFGAYVVKLRKEKGLKQIDLASALDIDVRVLRRIEKGETNVQILFLFELADVLGVKVIDFISSNKI